MAYWGDPRNGRVIFACWDGNVSDYNYVYPLLKEKGWPGVSGVMTDHAQDGSPNKSQVAELTEMALFGGWDIIGHGQVSGEDFSDPTQWIPVGAKDPNVVCATMRAALDSWCLTGNNCIGPASPSPLDYTPTWAGITANFDYVFCNADLHPTWAIWPRQSHWNPGWHESSDRSSLESIVAVLNETIDHPEFVAVVSIHRIKPGGNIKGFGFYKTLDGGATYPYHYNWFVRDGNPATYANLNALNTVAAGEWCLISSQRTFAGLVIDMSIPASVNTNASVLSVEYWDGAAWQAVAGLVDGTSVAGKTLAKSGDITWTDPGAPPWELLDIGEPKPHPKASYFIRFSVSAQLSASVSVTGCSPFSSGAGAWTSVDRLEEIIAYVEGIHCTVCSFTELLLDPPPEIWGSS